MPSDTVAIAAPAATGAYPNSALRLAGLPSLMELGDGKPDIMVALIDGPVACGHPALAHENIHVLGEAVATCSAPEGAARTHGTFVAGILHARRESPVPGICPGCTLLVRPIFSEPPTTRTVGRVADANVEELVAALHEVIEAGARIINLSAGLAESLRPAPALDTALDRAARRGVMVVAAAGNEAAMGSSAITRHPWVIPVIGCDDHGQPLARSTVGASIGRRGLAAPGHAITSLAASGGYATFSGSSAAVPFVAGTIALLWSAFPQASAARLRLAIGGAHGRRRSVTPPRLDAWAAFRTLQPTKAGGRAA